MVDMTQDDAGRKDAGPDTTKAGIGRWLPLAVIAAGAGIGYWLFRDYLTFETLRENREALIAWRDDNYLLAVLAYMGTYIAVVAFSLPGAAVMTLTGGFLFGLVFGTIFTVTAATIGAACIFIAARTSLGATLKEKAGPWMAKFEKGFQENEVSFLFLLRLVPAVPFFIANLLPAFFGVKLLTYVWTTFIGIAPGSAVYTSIGTGLGEVFAAGDDISFGLVKEPTVWGPLVGLIALALLPIIIKAVRGKPIAGEES
jgi:uncharacterized membrane protein YdjX (TVP38/TMEM64 family)